MRILSGIQPSGALHIGNYFGMMRPAIALQAEGEAFYFIAEYHALTSFLWPGECRDFAVHPPSRNVDRQFRVLRSGPDNQRHLRIEGAVARVLILLE